MAPWAARSIAEKSGTMLGVEENFGDEDCACGTWPMRTRGRVVILRNLDRIPIRVKSIRLKNRARRRDGS